MPRHRVDAYNKLTDSRCRKGNHRQWVQRKGGRLRRRDEWVRRVAAQEALEDRTHTGPLIMEFPIFYSATEISNQKHRDLVRFHCYSPSPSSRPFQGLAGIPCAEVTTALSFATRLSALHPKLGGTSKDKQRRVAPQRLDATCIL